MNGGWSTTQAQQNEEDQKRRKAIYDAKQLLFQKIGEMNLRIIELMDDAVNADTPDKANFYKMRAFNIAADKKVLQDALKVLDV